MLKKLEEKKCDWMLANKIIKKDPVFGSDENLVHYITSKTLETWPKMSKIQVAKKLKSKMFDFFNNNNDKKS